MAVVAGGVAGRTHIADHLALAHRLPRVDRQAAAVGVERLPAAAVVDDDVVAVAVMPAGGGDHAAVGGDDGGAVVGADVHALVAGTHPAADALVGGHRPDPGAVGAGDHHAVGQLGAPQAHPGDRLFQGGAADLHRLGGVGVAVVSIFVDHFVQAFLALLLDLVGVKGKVGGVLGDGVVVDRLLHRAGDDPLDLQIGHRLADGEHIAHKEILQDVLLGVFRLQLAHRQAELAGHRTGHVALLHGIGHLALLLAGEDVDNALQVGEGVGEVEVAVLQLHILGEFHPQVGIVRILIGRLQTVDERVERLALGGDRQQAAVHIDGGGLLDLVAGLL